MHRFEIIRCVNNRVFVTLTLYSHTSEFWVDLENELKRRGIHDAEVYFDFAVQSGQCNRFLRGLYRQQKLLDGIIPVVENDFEIVSIFNKYLIEHKDVIRRSMLSTREKEALLRLLLQK